MKVEKKKNDIKIGGGGRRFWQKMKEKEAQIYLRDGGKEKGGY